MADVRKVQVGDVALSVLEAGDGGRPLLLLHGFTGAKEDFADHLDRLAEHGWHAVAPDNRGHGASDHPTGHASYSLAIYAADTVGLADALGWRRFVLLGHSMGGMIAQVVAVERADRLDGLVLMDTGHGPLDGFDPDAIELGKQVVRAGGLAALVEAQRGRESELETPAHRRLLAERPDLQEWEEAKTLASSADMFLAMLDEMLAQPDRLDALAGLRVPTLVIVGEQDEPFVPHSERMAKAIPGARLAVLADAGHSPQLESPDVWWDALNGFLDALAPATGGVR